MLLSMKKRSGAILLAAGLAGTVIVHLSGAVPETGLDTRNLIANGSFEELDSQGRPAGWTTSQGADPNENTPLPEGVSWAIATRVQGERDILLVPGARGCRLDPTAQDITGLSRDGLVTKIGMDATRPIGYGYEWPRRLSNRLTDQIDLDTILSHQDKTSRSAEKP